MSPGRMLLPPRPARGQRGSRPPTRAAALGPRGAGGPHSAGYQPGPHRGSRGAQTREAGLEPSGAPPLAPPAPPRPSTRLQRPPTPRVGGGRQLAGLYAPRPTRTAPPRRGEDALARLGSGTSEALGTDVADARGSESTVGSGRSCRLSSPGTRLLPREAGVEGAHARPPGGAWRSPPSRRPPYLS